MAMIHWKMVKKRQITIPRKTWSKSGYKPEIKEQKFNKLKKNFNCGHTMKNHIHE
jgi:bifunctional DNA-binding transcriptional regulator/antitoxin component of YhaV-PrlF toxin-antitoxin module